MRESHSQEASLVATFGFENRRIAEVFAEDADDLPALLQLQPESLAGPFDDVCEIGRTMRFQDQGVCSIALRFIGDGDAISEVYERVQRYGGYLRGFLDGAPGPLALASELALERGWNPEMPGMDRSSEDIHSVEPAEFPKPYAPLKIKSAENSFDGVEDHAVVGETETSKGGKRSALPRVLTLVALAIVAIGLVSLGVGRFGVEKGPGGSDSPELESAREDPSLEARHAMAILRDAARLLPGQDETALGRTLESTELAAWINGKSVSRWNPSLLMLGPDLENLTIDPWGNPFKVRFDKTNEGIALRIWSMGPDGIDNDAKADDVVADPATMAAASGAIGGSNVMDLLSPSVKGADDAVGEWTTEGVVPISPETADYSLRPFVPPIPDSFEAKFIVERRSGDHAFVVGFPARGKRVTSLLDLPLQKGKESLRGVGIAHIVKSAGDKGTEAQLLPKGERKEVFVRVESGAITIGIRGSVEFSWNRGDGELGSFPQAFLDQAGDAPLFIGSWNSSFAIHGAELIDLGAGNAAPPPRPPILLPPEAEFPRSGVIALGWSDLGEFVDPSRGAASLASPDSERSRLVAVTLEVDDSDWIASEEDPVISALADGKAMPGLERTEVFKVGLFSIRVGAEVGEAAGMARSPSPASTEDDLEVLGLGESLNPPSGDQGNAWRVHRTREFMVVHPDPVDRTGRTKITLWSEFSPSDGIRPVHLKCKNGEWRRVPDRSIDPVEFPTHAESR